MKAERCPGLRAGWWLLFLPLLLVAPRFAWAENPHLRQGIEAYENFEYDQAVQVLQKALEHPDSTKQETAKVHLYLGLVRFTLGDRKGARESFRAALETHYGVEPPPDTSPKIVTEFKNVKKTVQAPVEPDLPPPPPPPPPTIVGPAKPRIWTWVAVGIGGAALIGGGTFAYLASSAKSDFDNATWADEAHDLKSTVESRSLTANILFGTGAAALVAGLVLFFTEGSPGEPESTETAGPAIMITPGGVEASFRF